MLEQLIYTPSSPLRQIFWHLPYKWQLKLILWVWEMQYRRRRRSWCRAGAYLAENLSYYGPGRAGLVSIVLPVYNQAGTLAASIDSVLEQTYLDWELIVVNDGSTDDTGQVLERYAHQPHVTIINQPNQHLPAALNRGFREAKGEFFTWTSGDNLMHPQQLERLVNYLQAQPEVALVYADFELIDDAGQPIKDADAIFMRGEVGTSAVRLKHEPERMNIGFECVVGPCFMYRRLLYPLIGDYNPALEGSEDFDYWMRINNFFQIRHLGDRQPLYAYRVHVHSMSAQMKPRISRQRRWLMQREQKFQQNLHQPVVVAVDERTASLMANLQPDKRAVPPLEFRLITGLLPFPPELTQAGLIHISQLNVELSAHAQENNWPLICWIGPDDLLTPGWLHDLSAVGLIIAPQADLLPVNNVVLASKPEDIYHLTRIFVASRRV